MDDPKSEDSLFADDIFSALETNESNIKCVLQDRPGRTKLKDKEGSQHYLQSTPISSQDAVSSSLHRDASGTGEVSEAESFKEILCPSKDHEIGSQIEVRKEYLNVTVQGEVTEEEIEGQVERVESDAVVVVDDGINISDLFENENIEFIYDIGQTGDAECEEEHGEIFVGKSLSEIVMNNETDGHTNEGNESFHLTVQEEEVIDDQMGEDMEKSSSQEGVAENDEVDEMMTEKKLFDEFWLLTWKEKEVYIKCNTTISKPKKRSGQTPSRRNGTVQYNLKHNCILKRVCKKMFLHTLGLNEWMVLNWIKKNSLEEQEVDNTKTPAETQALQTDTTIKEQSTSKMTKKRQDMKEWFESIPKLPSHYARRDTKKLYLEPIWISKREMYRAYKEKMIELNKCWGSEALFDDVFNELNVSLFSPRKDQCDLCCSYKLGHIPLEQYEQHTKEKKRARQEKEKDKELAIAKQIYCLTCDLQAVKITPLTKANSIYYKTKLSSHNFTVYDLASRDCTNYWFNETECDLTANTFATCLINFLEEKCLNPKLPIVIYSDGCTYQNRNQVMSNALLHFSITHNVEIEPKYLIKGHTQMECDSVHAQIERTLKGKDIYMPYEFVNYTKQARKEPFPYDAKYLSHDFFLDFTKILYYDSIRPGRLVGEPVVTDIHCILYKANGLIYYKLQFDDEYKNLPRRPLPVNKDLKPPRLYQQRLPILESKWKHLQELKSVIPSDFHSFYDNIPYGKNQKRKNQIQEFEEDKTSNKRQRNKLDPAAAKEPPKEKVSRKIKKCSESKSSKKDKM